MAVTRPRLGELLLAAGAVTRQQLQEAWEQKVLYGDRLGTNLLATGAIDEATLARALGQQLGVHSGHGKVVKPEPAALALVPKGLAERRFVVPHHIADRQLFLLMRDPLDAHAVDEVRFIAQMKVTPVVVCEARIWQLLELHYGARMSLRPVPLDVAPRRDDFLEDATGTVLSGPELVSEEEFQRLYATMHTPTVDDRQRLAAIADAAYPPIAAELKRETADTVTGPPPVAAPIVLEDDARFGAVDATNPGRPSAMSAHSFLAPPRTDVGANEWRETLEHTNPMLALPRGLKQDKPDAEPVPVVDLVELTDAVADMQPPLVRQNTLDFALDVDVAEVVEESPLSFAEANEVLRTAADREAIARVVLRAARTKFQRACLLTVFPDRLVGWMGLGEGFETDRMKGISLVRAERSVFGLVADSRAHYMGPLPKWSAHGAWVKATGRKIPKSIGVFPILVKGRPVNLLVVDNGHDQHVGSDVGDVLILAQQIAKTWESLLATP